MPHRWRKTPSPVGATSLTCLSYEDLRVQSVVLAYVVGEGHHEETIFELACRFSADDGGAVERAIRDLVVGGLLTIERGRVVPHMSSLIGQQG